MCGVPRHYQAVMAEAATEQIDATFSDFPGCVTVAGNLDEAHRRAAEVFSFHLQSMVKDGDPIPAGGDEDALIEMVREYQEEGCGVAIAAIGVEIPTGKARRVNVTLPDMRH
mgnify:CR=1 FL=1